MKKITQLLFLVSIILLTGCQPIVKILTGTRNPRFESESTIQSWLRKKKFPEVPVYSSSFEMWKSNTKPKTPEVFIFDNKGRYISYKNPSKPECTGPAELFISYMDTTQSYNYSDEYTLNSFVAPLKKLNCENVLYTKKENVDYHVFITFNDFMGNYFLRNKTYRWLDSLASNSNIKYELILVNTDLQSCWDSTQKAYYSHIKEAKK